VEGATYFLSRATIRVTDAPGMRRWRKRQFAPSHNAANPIEYFGLPPDRTISRSPVIGSARSTNGTRSGVGTATWALRRRGSDATLD
jgi:K+ potassium transporter C-terminal domain